MTTIPASIRERLEKPFQLTSDQIQFYQKNRFIKLKQVFDEETISFFNDVISRYKKDNNLNDTDIIFLFKGKRSVVISLNNSVYMPPAPIINMFLIYLVLIIFIVL